MLEAAGEVRKAAARVRRCFVGLSRALAVREVIQNFDFFFFVYCLSTLLFFKKNQSILRQRVAYVNASKTLEAARAAGVKKH